MQLSIALTTYNRSNTYLRYAIEAVLQQTYSDFELLILDNHSTDDTPNVVLGYNDPRITYLRQPEGSTPDFSWCRGLLISRGKYILITHDDDIMEPTLVERQMAFLSKHSDLLCVASNVSIIDEQNNVIQPRLYNIDYNRVFNVGEYIKAYLDEKLWLPTPTRMYRRDALLKVAGLKNGLTIKAITNKPSGDLLHCCSLNCIGPVGLLGNPLLRYRQHSGQQSRNVHQGQPLVEILKIIKKNAKANPVLKQYTSPLCATLARFEIQNLFFRYPKQTDLKQVTKHISVIKKRLEREIPDDQRGLDAIIPFEILLRELNLKPFCMPGYFKYLLSTPAKYGATQGFRNWLQVAHSGRNLFDSQSGLRQIAVFGSMLVAFLIVLEARRAGINVLCCIDSSQVRIGNEVLGVPIIPFDNLKRFDKDINAIILSNEFDHEEGIKKILYPYLPKSNLKVLSWKELAISSLQLTSTLREKSVSKKVNIEARKNKKRKYRAKTFLRGTYTKSRKQ